MSSNYRCDQCGADTPELTDGLCANCRAALAATVSPEGNDTTDDLSRFHDLTSGRSDFGEYELLEEIARGGMGVIFKARHRKLNRIVAVKMILSGRFSSKEELQRFHIEAEAAARLDHPGIVPVYDVGEVDGQAYFAMKFIDGGSLAERLSQMKLDVRSGIRLLVSVVRAVHHAHQRGILHRDLKPANILLDDENHPLITDLGLARMTAGDSNLTNTGAVVGTPSYMSPEQASGDTGITTAADVYALGAIMYELLTGRPPYRGSTAIETVMHVLNGPPVAPCKLDTSVDRDLELICMKCMERDPNARYESAQALADDLEAWLDGKSISIKPPTLTARTIRWFNNNRRTAYFIFAVLTGILVTMPFALTFVSGASGAGFDEVYDHFPPDQRPVIFSFPELPQWVGVSMALTLVFVLWPSVGFLNALVGRPQNILSAIKLGCATSFLLIAVFSVLLGWLPLMRVTSSESELEMLTNAVWPPNGASQQAMTDTANAMFVGLDEIPENERAQVVVDRIVSDRLAAAPTTLFIISLVECGVCIPLIYGTVMGYRLLARGQRLWFCFIRYSFAWWLTGVSIVAFLDGLDDVVMQRGLPLSDTATAFTISAIAALIVYLTIRQWRRSEFSSVNESTPTSANLTD